ncbi:ABC transporter ATP-binding protein [Acrocarpospora pleiomorpha]|uniref:ABC transporter ATP-binding protein n=1 Tax=Acrocarpospora pleiomorpha TaxID=90975 RepID=A0A5M3XTF3_9ACTN|nr:ABC transporter ATP-binding protein [Acrocarpospora pleiomorpha]GES21668.1 ABC transporter ATP-binding protein [Acrocarpospora pleiomorpha]
MTGRALLRGCLSAQRRVLAAAVASAVFRQVALLAIPWCVQRAVDDGITRGDAAATAGWALAVLVVSVAEWVGLLGWQWWANEADARTGVALRARLLRHVATLDDSGGRGDLAMRAGRDVDQVRAWVHGLTTWAVIGTTFVVVLPVLATLEPVLLVITLLMLPLLVAVNVIFPRRFEPALESLAEAHGARADAVSDLLSAVPLRGLGGLDVLTRRHHTHSAAVLLRTRRAARISAAWAASGPLVPRLAVVAGLGFGGLAVLSGDLTLGGLVAFTSWMTTVTLAVGVGVERYAERGQASVAARRIAEVLALRPAVADPAKPVALPVRGDLTFRGEEPELTVPPGELVAVTGPTGSGKTRLLRLLGRRADPDGGTVAYGGLDLRQAALGEVARRIVLVSQRPVLVSGTIADNLRLGRDLTDDELRAACAAAAIDLPLDTEVGERGGALSGGQVQRLAVARALLGRPAVLLLDDVTSALDVATERRLLDGVRRWSPGTAVVFVTHRAAVVEAADRVLDLGSVEVPSG